MSESKVVLVTGASGHLGSAIARASAQAGWAVAVHYRSSAQAAEQLVAEITDLGGSAHTFGADLGSEAAPARALVEAVTAHFGRLDALVNNSADQAPVPLPELTDIQWQDMLGATFLSAANVTRAAAEAMGSGAAVVNVTSVEASSAFPNHAHYAAAKAALESFTRSLALDFGPRGMRANAVAPGLIDTPIYGEGEASEQFKANLQKGVLFPQRLGFPDELASMVVECVTNSYMNAETIRVDGGIRMQPK